MNNSGSNNHVLGVVDTVNSRYDAGAHAERILGDERGVTVRRETVPDCSNLPLGCKRLVEDAGCDLVLALSVLENRRLPKTALRATYDKLLDVETETDTPILKVFAYEDEMRSADDVLELVENRIASYCADALAVVDESTDLTDAAGRGGWPGDDPTPLTDI